MEKLQFGKKNQGKNYRNVVKQTRQNLTHALWLYLKFHLFQCNTINEEILES